jgi:hypothetical protein
MTASLTFTLPDETVDHIWAVGAPAMAGTIIDLDNILRAWIKHGHSFTTTEQVIEAVRGLIREAHSIAEGTL